ncbi:RagB/SusD family nutrient uptake outer membrane protein [Flavihumibacter sp. UBA7668]|uniref:RagB/SusD family nutrient uptake outer membrane protein n=1 Tax=Flavihumibacter sp. UBA7668 TaxID=1946542 RepID=UPI0025C695D4|nr:RagB/SusD family nutrient uptake outer membrane protein [Flavihumibacter sp. UBA7668]
MNSYKINRKKILIPVIAVLALVIGCTKKLDQQPESQLSDSNFWKTSSDLAQAANYLYTFLNGLSTDDPSGFPTPLQDNYSDKSFGDRSVGFGDGSSVAPATWAEWTNYYKAIRAANNIIEKSGQVTGTAADINRYVGEARFFRAMSYFELVKRFGDVLLINRTLTQSDELLYAPRTARQIIVDSIYADLDFAAANCPQPDAMPASEYGRITRAAALAYKSRVGLFEGTWDKFRGIATAQSNLAIAKAAANAVITESKHNLYTAEGANSYYYEFQYDGGANGNPIQAVVGAQKNYTYAGNKENILVRLYGQNQTNNIASHSFGRTYLDQARIAPTRNMIDLYLYKDGLPMGKSEFDSTDEQTSTLTEFRNRDPRLEMSVHNRTMITPSVGGLIQYIPGTTYRSRKYWIVSDWTANVSYVNFNILRFAEVLLNYAEATYEMDGAISDADLNLTINALRNRATGGDVSKLPLLTNAFVSANGLDLQTEIRRERSVELAFEGHAYWDLLRWKTAETALPTAMLGRKYFPSENPGGVTPNLENGYVLLEANGFRTFNADRDYLWALPTRELALNPNLEQNPNW